MQPYLSSDWSINIVGTLLESLKILYFFPLSCFETLRLLELSWPLAKFPTSEMRLLFVLPIDWRRLVLRESLCSSVIVGRRIRIRNRLDIDLSNRLRWLSICGTRPVGPSNHYNLNSVIKWEVAIWRQVRSTLLFGGEFSIGNVKGPFQSLGSMFTGKAKTMDTFSYE